MNDKEVSADGTKIRLHFGAVYAPFEAERFQSLPPELAEKYREKFKYPERFMRVNNEIVAVPFKPVRADKER